MSPFPRWMKVILVPALLILLVGGAWLYRTQEQNLRGQVEKELTAIAQLKANQIVEWRANQLGEADELMSSLFFAEGVMRWLAESHGETPEEILSRFRSLQKHYHYYDVLLIAPDGRVLLSLNGASGRGHIEILPELDAALRERKPSLTDLHICEIDPTPHISVIAPIFGGKGLDQNPLGAVILVSDARQFLYSLIQTWPTLSKTAETLLVRRDGDDILYLNDLRHHADAALKLRIPLSRTEVPAVMAVLGKKGILNGRDYRGVEVVAAVLPIPDSPWFMVAKVDATEAFAAWRFRSVLILALLVGLAILGGAGIFIVWQRREKAHFRALYLSEAARRASEERHGITLKSIGDAVIVTDAEGRVELLNRVAEVLTGWPNDDARGKPLSQVFPAVSEESRLPVENPVARVLRDGTVAGFGNHTLLIARDGTEHPIADSGARVCNEQGEVIGVVLVFRDQSEERAAQRALQERERKFRETVTFLDEGYYSATIDGVILEHNPAFNRILGFELTQDLKGMTLPIFWQNPNDRKEYLNELMAKGYVRNYLANAKTIHEGKIVTMVNAHLERDETGTPVGIEGTIADITELKREEERFRVAAESLSDVIYEWDLAERVDWFGNIDGLMGYESGKFPRTLTGWAETLHPDDRERVMAAVNRHLRGEAPYDIEYRIRKKDGDYSHWTARGSVIRDSSGKATRWIGTITDITERKRADEALRKLNEDLARSNKELEQFAYVASHDLQEPLRTVSSYTQLLAKRYEGRLDQDADEFIHYVVDGANRMQRLIQDLLAYARITTHGSLFVPLDLHEALGEAVANLQATINESAAVVTNGELPTINADRRQLVQVFQNLIGNGIKFRKNDEPPRVHISSERAGREWIISVKDNGIGIDPQYFNRLFIIFQRLHGKQEYSGTGIGLAICQRIVARHGGRIWVESAPGEGATFRFSMKA